MSQQQRIGTAATCRLQGPDTGYYAVLYHQTKVVQFNNEEIILRTGGWKSDQTKVRMNQVSNQFGLHYKVCQKDHEWFVDYDGKTFTFDNDELILKRSA